jgi:signal transduction histidine kinase/CheY-like chemotaxis protein
LANDWRFEKSPHVDQGGLRAYAGVPLKFETEFGEHVAFGSLCVASNSAEALLSKSEQQSLVRLADWVVTDIVHSARIRRQQERRRMMELISSAQQQCDNHVNMEETIPELLREVYSGTTVSLHHTRDGQVTLGATTFRTAELQLGLWEDTQYFDYIIEKANHLDVKTSRAVRAIAAQCTNQRTPTFLVVASNDFRMVFDDVDSWFVHMCANILCRFWQARALREALTAKETFLRGITHQLRTPIHGILGSVELLTEELRTRNVVPFSPASSPNATPDGEQLDPYTYIRTIKTSARELISTINSLIKLNQWADILQAERILTRHKISDIESALLNETLLGLSDDLSTRPSIFLQHHFPPGCDMLAIDMRVFLDCVQPLIINAAQHSAGGVIAVTLSLTKDCQSLIVDVEDNGRGIASSNFERIFNAYEKVDLSTAESGLGLTLACKAATLLGGEVTLVSSHVGHGSHFRVRISDPICASSYPRTRAVRDRLVQLPPTFHRLAFNGATSSLSPQFGRYLSDAGYVESETSEGAFMIVDYTSNLARLYKDISNISTGQVAICLVPESACFLDFQKERIRRQDNIVYVLGPFLPEVLEQALERADAILAEFGSLALNTGSCAFGGVVIEPSPSAEPSPPPTPIVLGIRPEMPSERGSIFPQKAQTELVQSLHSLHIQTDPLATATRRSGKPMTLLVDDNAVNLRLLVMYCNRRGIPYRTAKDGQEAVKVFSEALLPKNDPLLQQSLPVQPFELVLMDLQMPICDGIDATRQIRRIEKEQGLEKSIMFIVTGQDSPADRKNADEAGADSYLVKPVGPKVLDRWIKQWCPTADI